ncbi:MAG: cell division protein FtsZ [Bacteroidetes bacterium]|nr:MAG: cell division protein FtsZ [Bacteroidota bacterium]
MNGLKFDLPKDKSSIIKVLGVGGGGGNAVNHMFNQGIKGVDFVICNTDLQALEASPIPNKIQLGVGLTAGLGAGADPEKGHNSAMEAIEDIIEVLGVNTKMLFVTAGMGGGTGTGAAPVIAKAARELDILTVGIVTTPFSFEGKKRKGHAEEGIEQLKRSVDCLLVINNDKIKEMYGNLPIRTAFSHANDILTIAAKGIAEIITYPGYINVDFEDVKTVMRNSGVALMGSASAEGENRAMEAVKAALASPLLNDNQIRGAKNILLNISFGANEVLMDEIDMISTYIQEEAGQTADVIFGTSIDESLGDKLAVTIICTGFESRENKIIYTPNHEQKTKHVLYETPAKTQMVIGNPLADAIKQHVQPSEEVKPVEAITENPVVEEQKEIRFELIMDEPTVETQPEIVPQQPEAIVEKENTIEPFIKPIEAVKEDVEELFIFDEPEVPIAEAEQPAMIEQQEVEQPITEDFEFELEETGTNTEQEERIKQSIARLKKIKELNLQINTPIGLRDLEKEPAYLRRQKKLNEVPHSSENAVSRLSLFDDGTNNGIRTNNSFLHDNVD